MHVTLHLRRSSWKGVVLFFLSSSLALAILLVISGTRLWREYDVGKALAVDASGILLDRDGHWLHVMLNQEDQWAFPVENPLANPTLVQATIAAEDQRFWEHKGVDVWAIGRAFWQLIRHRQVRSGASTLSMQVVKLGGVSSGHIAGKIRQTLLALRLERACDKSAILRAYFNKAPYGLNLIGVEAASRRYFGKPAVELNLTEAATLAALPKAPSRLQPLKYPGRILARRNYVLRRMAEEGFLSDQEAQQAQARPVTVAWHDFPQQARHLAAYYRKELGERKSLQLCIDGALQEKLEAIAPEYLKRFDQSITNCAVMVLRADTMEVLARLGSADFFNTPGGGQVDVCHAPRSPGSTLKPFAYALAMEKHRLYPSEYLLDDTLDFGSYNPGNFDGRYKGLVTASEALHYSLNIPALLVLNRVGVTSLVELLQKSGLSTLHKDPAQYGLGLTLGNCEVRLEELTAAYAMLANLGRYRPLVYRMQAPPAQGPQLLSEATCLALYEMLGAPLPHELSDSFVRPGVSPDRVCWKTGTSTGYLDAWSFVFNRNYLVGVWLGNNDAASSRQLIGATAALPLAARLFRMLPSLSQPAWPEAGAALHKVRICATSGLPASPWCEKQKTVIFPKTFYLNRRCDMHRPHPESKGTLAYWPGSALHWDLAQVQIQAEKAGGGPEGKQQKTLAILKPSNRAEYVLTGEAKGDRIHLQASTEQLGDLYWYYDDRYLGLSTPATPLYLRLETGTHQLSCMDPSGARDSVTFSVLKATQDLPLLSE